MEHSQADCPFEIGQCLVLAGSGISFAGRLQSFDPVTRLAVLDNWTAEETFRVDEDWGGFTGPDGSWLELRGVSPVVPAGSGAYPRKGAN